MQQTTDSKPLGRGNWGSPLTRAERRREVRDLVKKISTSQRIPVTVGETSRRTAQVAAFLKKFRAAGLPTSKKFRKRTRVQRLTAEKDFFFSHWYQAGQVLKAWEPIIQRVANEENWVLRERTPAATISPEGEIKDVEVGSDLIWNGDEGLINDAQKVLKIIGGPVKFDPENNKAFAIHPSQADELTKPLSTEELKELDHADEEKLSGEEAEAAGGSGGAEQADPPDPAKSSSEGSLSGPGRVTE